MDYAVTIHEEDGSDATCVGPFTVATEAHAFADEVDAAALPGDPFERNYRATIHTMITSAEWRRLVEEEQDA